MKKNPNEEKTLFITAEQDGFTLISNNITRNTFLSDGAKSLYIYLKSHSEDFKISIENIARYLKKSIATIKRELQELKQSGFLIIEKKPNANAYYYRLNNSPKNIDLEEITSDKLVNYIINNELQIAELKRLLDKKIITESQVKETFAKLQKILKTKWLDN